MDAPNIKVGIPDMPLLIFPWQKLTSLILDQHVFDLCFQVWCSESHSESFLASHSGLVQRPNGPSEGRGSLHFGGNISTYRRSSSGGFAKETSHSSSQVIPTIIRHSSTFSSRLVFFYYYFYVFIHVGT